jgi:hypothetical protein
MHQLTSCTARACLDGCKVRELASRETEPYLAQWQHAYRSAVVSRAEVMVNTRLLCEPCER